MRVWRLQGDGSQTRKPGRGPPSDCPSSVAELRRVEGLCGPRRAADQRVAQASLLCWGNIREGPPTLKTVAAACRAPLPRPPETEKGLLSSITSGWRTGRRLTGSETARSFWEARPADLHRAVRNLCLPAPGLLRRAGWPPGQPMRPPARRLSWGQDNPEPNVVVPVGRVVVVAGR